MSVFRIIFAAINAFVGLSAFVAFILLKNYPSSLLAICTGFLGFILLVLHWLDHRKTLYDWYSRDNLHQIKRWALVFLIATAVVLIYYVALQSLLLRPILPIQSSLVIPIVWCCLALKSSILLYLYAGYYAEHIEVEELLQEEQVVTEE